VPMVVRIVGTNAEEAKPILAEANLITADSLDDAAAKAVAAAKGAVRHEHPRQRATRASSSRASPAARASSTRPPCSSTARRSWPASRPARAARPRSTGACRSSTPSPRPSADRRQHVVHLRAGGLRARRDARGGGGGIPLVFCITEGDPGARHAPGRPTCCGGRRATDRAELPGCSRRRRGEGRDHPRRHPPRGSGRRRLAVRDADLRGRPGDDRCGHRPVDLRRHRRRPGHRDDVHRRARLFAGPRHRCDRDDRRDRRRGGGEGRCLGCGPAGAQADGGVHRRPHRARGKADGPRRGDHLGRRGHGRVQGDSPRGGRDPRRGLTHRDPAR
jgi:hypothetical protein